MIVHIRIQETRHVMGQCLLRKLTVIDGPVELYACPWILPDQVYLKRIIYTAILQMKSSQRGNIS
ncbi:hypothetical protein D9611_011215 [Ephemerocybe angulata]|uniref:Uncharacterized protein n=1 Tax=Ephemerocybe angulata TaxID=980116 RepID=A0A8H5FJI7_9AGAR|nr:hypothetical protein D9611_011215 [Tulosesus angulatus]